MEYMRSYPQGATVHGHFVFTHSRGCPEIRRDAC